MNFSPLLPLFVVLPLMGAFLTSLLGRSIKRLPDVIPLAASSCSFIMSLVVVGVVQRHGAVVCNIGAWKSPIGIAMVADGLSVFMLVVVHLIAMLVSVYAIGYMKQYTAKWKYAVLFLLMMAGMNGVIITGDIFNLFVFLEIASIATWALVAFGTERHELEAAFKYAVMSTLGALFILLGIAFLYSFTSTLNMADMALILGQKGATNIVIFSGVLFLVGFGLKAAIVPFHAWLPDAHPAAPAPISAMLSSVLVKTLGIYSLCRIFYNVLGFTEVFHSIFMFLGALSIIVGTFLAIGQWDFKRLLACSSISQIGYIVLGFGLGTPLGILGAVFHIFNHAAAKSLLFLNAGTVEYATGTRDLREVSGLQEKLPLVARTTLIASLSVSGIPPLGGFWSKLILVIALVQAQRIGYALVAVLASVVTLAYFMKVIRHGFLGKAKYPRAELRAVPACMLWPTVVLAFICIVGGLLLVPSCSQFFLRPAQEVLREGMRYSMEVFGQAH